MKYCVPYSRHFKYINEIDEVIIEYDSKKNSDIIKVLLDNKDAEYLQNKRLIIYALDFTYFIEWKTIEGIKTLKEKAPNLNIAVMLTDSIGVDLNTLDKILKQMRDAEIPYFFDARISDWDIFHNMISKGVSDVYIVESLGFELNKLGPVAHAVGVSIRVFANVCQKSCAGGDMLTSFFIRPEGIPEYESYVDVVEFFAENTNQYEVFYKIYAKDKKWFGDLSEIIIGLDVKLDSRFVLPIFDKMRIKCGKKCLKGHPCNICPRLVETAETFEDNQLIVKY